MAGPRVEPVEDDSMSEEESSSSTSSTESRASSSESESESESAVEADDDTFNHIQSHFISYRKYTRYLKSKAPMLQCAKLQNTAAINKLLAEKARLKADLKSYRESLNSADVNGATSQAISETDRCLRELAAIKKTPAAKGIISFSSECKVITGTDADDFQNNMVKQIKEYLGIVQSSGIRPDCELRSVAAMNANNISVDFFKPNSARVTFTMAGATRLASVQRMRDGLFVNELYGVEQFGLPGPLAIFDKFRSATTDSYAWAIAEVENFRHANPTPDDSIAISGKMPPQCIEAMLDYCEVKGYQCINLTGVDVKSSKKRVAALHEKLISKPEKLVGTNIALAHSDESVANLEKQTTFSP